MNYCSEVSLIFHTKYCITDTVEKLNDFSLCGEIHGIPKIIMSSGLVRTTGFPMAHITVFQALTTIPSAFNTVPRPIAACPTSAGLGLHLSDFTRQASNWSCLPGSKRIQPAS